MIKTECDRDDSAFMFVADFARLDNGKENGNIRNNGLLVESYTSSRRAQEGQSKDKALGSK